MKMSSNYTQLYDRLFMPTEDTLNSLQKLEKLEQMRKQNQMNISSLSAAPSRGSRVYKTYDSASLAQTREPTTSRRQREPALNRRQNLHSSYQRTSSYDSSTPFSSLRDGASRRPVIETLSDRVGNYLRRGSDTTGATLTENQYLDTDYTGDKDYLTPSKSRSDHDRRRSHSLTDAVLSGEQQVSLYDIYGEGQRRHGYSRSVMSLTPSSSIGDLTEDVPDNYRGTFVPGEEYKKACEDIQNLSNISDLPPLEDDERFQTYISNVAPETDFELYEHQQQQNKRNLSVPVNNMGFSESDLQMDGSNELNTGQLPQPLSAPYYPSTIRQLSASTNDLETVEEETEGTFSPFDRARKSGNSPASPGKMGMRSPRGTEALTIKNTNCQLVTDLDAPESESKLVTNLDAPQSECMLVTDLDAPESESKLVTDLDVPHSECKLVTDLDAPESECKLVTDLDAPEMEEKKQQTKFVELTYSDMNDNVCDREDWVVIEDAESYSPKKSSLEIDMIKYIDDTSDEPIKMTIDSNVDNESLDSLPDEDYKLAPEGKKDKSEFKVTVDNVASESDNENYETASDTEDNVKESQKTVDSVDSHSSSIEMYQPSTDTYKDESYKRYDFSTDWEEEKMKYLKKYSQSEDSGLDLNRSPVDEAHDSRYRMQFSRRRPMNYSSSFDSSSLMTNSYSPGEPYTSGSSYVSSNFTSIRSPSYLTERPFLGSTSTTSPQYPKHVQGSYSQTPSLFSSVGTGVAFTGTKVDSSTQTDPEPSAKSEISIQTEVRCLTSKGTQTPDKESTTFKDTLIERGLANNRSLQGQLTEIRSTIKTVLETTPEEPQFLSVKEKKQLFTDKAESTKEPPLKGKKELFPKNEPSKTKKAEVTKTILFDLKKPVHNNKSERPSKLDKVKSALFSGKGKTDVTVADGTKMADSKTGSEPERARSPEIGSSFKGDAVTEKRVKIEQNGSVTSPLSPTTKTPTSPAHQNIKQVSKTPDGINIGHEISGLQSNPENGFEKIDINRKMKGDNKNTMDLSDESKKMPPKLLTKPKSLKLDKVYWFDDKVEKNETKSPEAGTNMMKKTNYSVSCSSLDRPAKLKLNLQSSDSNLAQDTSDQDKTTASEQQFTSIRENPFIRNDKTKAELKDAQNRNFVLPNVWQKFSGKNIVSSRVKQDDEIMNKANPFLEMMNNEKNTVDKTSSEIMSSDKKIANLEKFEKEICVSPTEKKMPNAENSKQRAIPPEKSPKSKTKPVSRKGSLGKKNKKRQVSQVQKQTWSYQDQKLVPDGEQTAASDVDSVLSRTPSVSSSMMSITSSTGDDSIGSSSGIVSASSPDISHPLSSEFSSSTNLMETDIDEAIRKAVSPERIGSVSSLQESEQGVDLLKKTEHLEFAETICNSLNTNKSDLKNSVIRDMKNSVSRDSLSGSKNQSNQTKKGKSKKAVGTVV